jgi:hypothetical protein
MILTRRGDGKKNVPQVPGNSRGKRGGKEKEEGKGVGGPGRPGWIDPYVRLPAGRAIAVNRRRESLANRP